jgi:hypothetical protein
MVNPDWKEATMPAAPRTIYRIIDSPTTFTYAALRANPEGLVEGLSMKQLSRALVDEVTPDWPVVVIERSDWEALIIEPKWYLKCEDCGEVFDAIDAAAKHGPDDCPDFNIDTTYTIVTEDEAF